VLRIAVAVFVKAAAAAAAAAAATAAAAALPWLSGTRRLALILVNVGLTWRWGWEYVQIRVLVFQKKGGGGVLASRRWRNGESVLALVGGRGKGCARWAAALSHRRSLRAVRHRENVGWVRAGDRSPGQWLVICKLGWGGLPLVAAPLACGVVPRCDRAMVGYAGGGRGGEQRCRCG
jgi:hypothetical protein